MVAGTPELIRNLDLSAELERMAQGLTVDWIAATSRAVVQVEQGMRRNLLRSLSLDAMAVEPASAITWHSAGGYPHQNVATSGLPGASFRLESKDFQS